MAEAAEIEELRRLISQPDDVAPWTDVALGERIDDHTGTMQSLAAEIWREKAATAASLVDMKEGNSSRSLSQLQEQALRMAASLDSADVVSTARPTRTRKIDRQ